MFVNPGKKQLDKKEFLRHLIVALKAIKPISAEEEKVIIIQPHLLVSRYLSLEREFIL